MSPVSVPPTPLPPPRPPLPSLNHSHHLLARSPSQRWWFHLHHPSKTRCQAGSTKQSFSITAPFSSRSSLPLVFHPAHEQSIEAREASGADRRELGQENGGAKASWTSTGAQRSRIGTGEREGRDNERISACVGHMLCLAVAVGGAMHACMLAPAPECEETPWKQKAHFYSRTFDTRSPPPTVTTSHETVPRKIHTQLNEIKPCPARTQ